MNEALYGETLSGSNALTVSLESAPAAVIVAAAGEIDVANAPVLRTALHNAACDSDIIVADLSDATYIDSSTVELVVVTARELRVRRGELRVVAPLDSRVRRVLAISGVERELALYESRDEAAKAS